MKKSREFHDNESEIISGESIGGAALIRGRRLLTFLSQMRRLFEGGSANFRFLSGRCHFYDNFWLVIESVSNKTKEGRYLRSNQASNPDRLYTNLLALPLDHRGFAARHSSNFTIVAKTVTLNKS